VSLVRVLPDADREVDAQADYYTDRGTPATAERWYRRTDATFQYLARNPGIGLHWRPRRPDLAGIRIARVEGFERFVVVYREIPGGIEVLHVLSGLRDLDRIL
jgi:toxin ParE1/3/4